ncbi:MAG: HAMP domain-containing histidine kinase [Bdellovibrionales bacterium]|nr:HAMP domain-containing histidine kinase [Bdellovibrionales bacterium]
MVFVTANHDPRIESINVKLGEDSVDQWDYLNKPFTKSEIIQKSRNFLALWNLKEQQSIKDQQLKELNNLLSDHERKNMLAAISRGVSHEFGNILQQIIGKAELSVNKSEAGMKEALNKILDASQKASDILQRFKNMTENHQSTSEKELVNVNELIKGTIDLMEHQFKVHQVKVCVIKNDPVFVNADPTALMQVFVNLFINASHAMVGAGQVDVSLINKADGQSLIVIRDYGPGVKSEEIEKVFEPLYTTKGEKGTGLGLPICREIIEIEHRGHLTLKNHPDKGLMVEILLPTQGVKDVAS